LQEAAAGPALRYATGAGRWVIAAAVLGSGVAALDSTIVSIALPAIGREFGVGVADLQWVVTGYLLTLAGLLLLAGALGDRYGRKRVFLIGVVSFGIASLFCGLAPNINSLIVARALQGIGGALLTPGSLAILEASFEPADRAKAIGAWSGLGGVATAVGPFIGGYLIAAVSWRLIFLINLPLIVAVVLISLKHVPESRDPAASGRIDVLGALLATVALGGICYGLIEWPALGWTSPLVLGALVLGLVSLTMFVLVETRVRRPLLPLALFRSRQFTAANLVTLVVYAALGGGLFLLPIELQEVAHYTPLQAGTALLPITFIMLILSARSGALASRIGPRLQMSVGPLIVAAGMILFARIDASGSYLLQVLPAVLVFGLGLAVTVAPLTSTVLDAAPTHEAGVASAVNNDVARAASLLAVAILPPAAGITGTSYLDPNQLSEGFRNAVFIAAALCASGGLLAALTIRNPPRDRQAPSGPVAESDRHSSHCALEATPLRPRVRL
jgi:EmrB/QacA subfamily drug resistance transporter